MTTTMIAPTLEGRRAAGAAGQLATFAGEGRKNPLKTDLRAKQTEKDGKTFETLEGYASMTELNYTMWDFFGEYEEKIAKGAFDKTLANSPDVAYLLNHTGMTMARTVAGTLRLSVDETGLWTEADLNPQRSDVQDLVHAVRDGNIDQMSFAFRIVSGHWSPDYTEYTIDEVDLDRGDVSAVNYGANPFTSISARANQGFEAVRNLTGAPLRALAAYAQERAAEVEPATAEVTAGPNAATLRARLEIGGI